MASSSSFIVELIPNGHGAAHDDHVVVRVTEPFDGNATGGDHPTVLDLESNGPVGEDILHDGEVEGTPVLGWDRQNHVELQSVVPVGNQPVHGWDGIELDGIPTRPNLLFRAPRTESNKGGEEGHSIWNTKQLEKGEGRVVRVERPITDHDPRH
jgi:hypothetical protein